MDKLINGMIEEGQTLYLWYNGSNYEIGTRYLGLHMIHYVCLGVIKNAKKEKNIVVYTVEDHTGKITEHKKNLKSKKN
jgi:hypothetical protein